MYACKSHTDRRYTRDENRLQFLERCIGLIELFWGILIEVSKCVDWELDGHDSKSMITKTHIWGICLYGFKICWLFSLEPICNEMKYLYLFGNATITNSICLRESQPLNFHGYCYESPNCVFSETYCMYKELRRTLNCWLFVNNWEGTGVSITHGRFKTDETMLYAKWFQQFSNCCWQRW